jgi:hypothetical protein
MISILLLLYIVLLFGGFDPSSVEKYISGKQAMQFKYVKPLIA